MCWDFSPVILLCQATCALAFKVYFARDDGFWHERVAGVIGSLESKILVPRALALDKEGVKILPFLRRNP